jgi:hypothetical protein
MMPIPVSDDLDQDSHCSKCQSLALVFDRNMTLKDLTGNTSWVRFINNWVAILCH